MGDAVYQPVKNGAKKKKERLSLLDLASFGGAEKPKNLVEVKSEAEFARLVKESEGSVVDWTATWCGPCQMIAPHFLELAKLNASIKFLKVDLDEHQNLATQHNIKSVPTFCFFKRGVEVDRMTGNNPAGLSDRVRRHFQSTSL